MQLFFAFSFKSYKYVFNGVQEILTISCTLNCPDSLSFVEDWIRFSCDGSLLGFLRVGDADLFFAEKYCFCVLDEDSIKAECFDEAGFIFCLSVVSYFQRWSMTHFYEKQSPCNVLQRKKLFPPLSAISTPSWINKSHSPLGVCLIFPWYIAKFSAMIWKMAGSMRGKFQCYFCWKGCSQQNFPSSW